MKKQILLKAEDFIKTFNSKQKELLENYLTAKELIEIDAGITEIHRKTKIPMNRLSNWTGRRKSVPFSVRCLTRADERGYFHIDIPSRKAEKLAYLIGYSMGDGNVSKNFCHTWFYGHADDLPLIQKLLVPFMVNGVIYVYKIHNGKMAVSDNAFARFMAALDSPVGDKTNSKFDIPEWIINTKKRSDIKKNFLQGLCDSELSKISLLKKNRFAFQSLKFYSIKTEKLVSAGIRYLNQIRALLSEFDVRTAEVKIDRSYVRSRDNRKMFQLYFVIYSNYVNLSRFVSRIGFLYNKKRRDGCTKYAERIKRCAKMEIEKNEDYKKAMKMRKNGFSAYRISNELNIPVSRVKNWVYRGCKPRLHKYLEN